MRVRFTKLGGGRHRLEVFRPDGVDAMDCETRSFLLHDLTHFALETAAGLSTGFYGLLAQGRQLADMHGGVWQAQALEIEQAVGALHNLAKGMADARQVLERLKSLRRAQGLGMPKWLTEQAINDAAEHLRRLTGHWASLKPGEHLELEFGNQPQSVSTKES